MPPYGLSRNANGMSPASHNPQPWGAPVANKVPQSLASRQQQGSVPHTKTLHFSTPNDAARQQPEEQPRAVHVSSQPTQSEQSSAPIHYWERRKAAMRANAKKKQQQGKNTRAAPKPSPSAPQVTSVPEEKKQVVPEEKKQVVDVVSMTDGHQEQKKTVTKKPVYGNMNGQKQTYVSHWKKTENNNQTTGAQPTQKKSRTPSPSSKSVKFGDVTITQFERALGDNPCAHGGAPLGMSMKHMSSSKKSLNVYEGNRGARGPKKTNDQMRIPLASRRNILMEARTNVDEWNRVEGELQAINVSRIADMNMRSYGAQFENDERDDCAPHDC